MPQTRPISNKRCRRTEYRHSQYPVIVSLVVHKHGAIEVDAVKERLAHPDGDSAVPAYTGSVTLLAELRLTLENILPIISHLPQRLRLCT